MYFVWRRAEGEGFAALLLRRRFRRTVHRSALVLIYLGFIAFWLASYAYSEATDEFATANPATGARTSSWPETARRSPSPTRAAIAGICHYNARRATRRTSRRSSGAACGGRDPSGGTEGGRSRALTQGSFDGYREFRPVLFQWPPE